MYELNMPHHVFAVWGSQSSGKTTLACNMAVAIANSGLMTCLVSANDHGEFMAFLGTAISNKKGMYAALSSGKNVREALTEARPNLCILEANTEGDAYDLTNISRDQVHGIIADLRDQFPFVIIDCTSSKDSIFTGLGLVNADKVICCIPHRVTAATWHIANKQMLEAVANKIVYVDVNTREGGCNMDQLLTSIGLPECEIRIPCVDTAYKCENQGKPIVLQSGKSEKRYRTQVLKTINYILGITANETANAKRNRRKAAGKLKDAEPERQVGLAEDDPRRIHTTTGLSHTRKSSRKMEKDDDAAIRRLNERRGQPR